MSVGEVVGETDVGDQRTPKWGSGQTYPPPPGLIGREVMSITVRLVLGKGDPNVEKAREGEVIQ